MEPVCQSETQAFDPFWDAPRLSPLFVAQLLGQVMPEHRDPRAMAQRAYGARAAETGLAADRKS